MTQRVWLGMLDRATEPPDETHDGLTAATGEDEERAHRTVASRTAANHGVRPLTSDLKRRGGMLAQRKEQHEEP